MDEPSPAIRRVCVSVDLTGAGDVARLLRHADRHARLNRDRWLTQVTGTGEIALLPPGIDESTVLPSLVRALFRSSAGLGAGSRLRVAVHQGLTTVGAAGVGGEAVRTLRRLRSLTAGSPASFTLAISTSVFEGLPGLGLPQSSFRWERCESPPAEGWIFADDNRS